jgi:DNA invertase Pin-like site-specific DNA recombinase
MSRNKSAPREAAKVCVVYCRVSSAKQATEDKGSLDAQEASGLRKAAELGLRVLYVAKDAESAWILDKRTKFRQILDDAKAGKFSVMIVDRMNRFTRAEDLSEYMQVMTELKLAGVEAVFVQRDYERSPLGQVQQVLDAYASAVSQGERRGQALLGMRTRVIRDHRPAPGHHAPYGYRWADATKTHLAKSGDQAQAIVERIWREFLTGERPTLRGVSKSLNTDGVPTPNAYSGIPNKRAKNRWTITTVRSILRDPRYYGAKPIAFARSKHNDPVEIPVYAPPYATAEEAARVHARLKSNWKSASRNRKRDWGTLLEGGLAKCGECGSTLGPKNQSRRRKDGSQLVVYRCPESARHGRDENGCGGVTISAEALDFAVKNTLDEKLSRSPFLANLFAAWDRDADAASSSIRSIEADLADIRQKISNGTARLLRYAVDDPLAEEVEAEVRRLREKVPGLEERLRQAREAVNAARNNPTLRDELVQWFDAWLIGIWELPTIKQRDFLFTLNAEVRLWREGEHQPTRAQLRIGLPVKGAGALPPPPAILDISDDDIATSLEYSDWVRGGGYFADDPPPDGARPQPFETAEEVMQAVRDEMRAQTHERMQSHDPSPTPKSPIAFNSAGRASRASRSRRSSAAGKGCVICARAWVAGASASAGTPRCSCHQS